MTNNQKIGNWDLVIVWILDQLKIRNLLFPLPSIPKIAIVKPTSSIKKFSLDAIIRICQWSGTILSKIYNFSIARTCTPNKVRYLTRYVPQPEKLYIEILLVGQS
jgi:hypothetical protein